jgi:catechol 2,3-dioxygenase-like lactoylglutathione lyase family enzyme
MKPHFDCVFYYVSHLERSVRFYQDVLGLKLISQDVVARFDIDGVLFEVVPAPDQSVLQQAGNARLCLRVDDVEKALAELQAKGVRTSRAESKEGGKLGSFEDPDGNTICLWQYVPGRDDGGKSSASQGPASRSFLATD